MPLLQKSDLKFEYSWKSVPPDNPKNRGNPDSSLLNRQEGYEVLDFINDFAVRCGFKQKASGLKVERMLKKHLPGDIRGRANVRKWLTDNWEEFD